MLGRAASFVARDVARSRVSSKITITQFLTRALASCPGQSAGKIGFHKEGSASHLLHSQAETLVPLLVGRCVFSKQEFSLPLSIWPTSAAPPRAAILPGNLDIPISLPAVCSIERIMPGVVPGVSSSVDHESETPYLEAPTCGDMSTKIPLVCGPGARRRARKSQGLFERWWLEYDPLKANYISGKGRGPHGGNSIRKADWPRQMVPIQYKKTWEQREKTRYAFRKHGYEYDIPKWGG